MNVAFAKKIIKKINCIALFSIKHKLTALYNILSTFSTLTEKKIEGNMFKKVIGLIQIWQHTHKQQQQQQQQQISMTEWEGSIKAAAANDMLSEIGHMSSATGYNQLWTAYPCMQATRGVLKGGNPWLTLAPSSSRVVTTWRFVVPMTQANTSGVNSWWCSFSSWSKDTEIQRYKDTRMQGYFFASNIKTCTGICLGDLPFIHLIND